MEVYEFLLINQIAWKVVRKKASQEWLCRNMFEVF